MVALVVGTHLKSPRHVIDHTPKKLFITKFLKSTALIFLENRQIITQSTLVLSGFRSNAVYSVSLAIFNTH